MEGLAEVKLAIAHELAIDLFQEPSPAAAQIMVMTSDVDLAVRAIDIYRRQIHA